MTTIGWSKRSSKNRISYTQFVNEMSRQSQSIERPSRIPLRSSSQSGRERIVQNQPKQRSKSQVSAGNSETPLSHGKITPSQYGSRLTSGASSNASSKKPSSYKDPRNLQDKEFQKEATYLVQSYFQEKCPEILINNSEIRPMTIKMFIAMVNHLFDGLRILHKGVEPVRFAVSTYEKELPFWMKKLEYPGLITKAWLQTVNVPQYWPHVVGLLSWLVKLVTVSSMFSMEEQINFPRKSLNETWGIFFFQKSMQAFRFYNEGKEDEYKELCREVIDKFYEMNGVSDDAVKAIEDEIAQLKEKIEDPVLLAEKDACDKVEQQIKVLEIQQQKLIDEIEKKEINIAELKSKLGKNEKNCTLLRTEIEDTKNDIARLKTTISTQAISVEDIAEIQKKTVYLDKEIKCLKKECDDYSQLLSRYEVEAAEIRDKILQSSHAFNRNIIQLEQMIPELSMFHIHIDLENKKVVSCMEDMVKSMESLKNSYIEKYHKLEDELLESQKMSDEKKNRLKEQQKAIRIQAAKNENKKIMMADSQASFDKEENLLKEEIASLTEKNQALKNKIKEVNDLSERKKHIEARYESSSKALEEKKQFWLEFRKNVEDKWSHIPIALESLLKMVNEQNKELELTLQKKKENADAGNRMKS